MRYLYVCTQGAKIGYEANRIVVKKGEDILQSVPVRPLMCIEVFGNIQITTQALQACFRNHIHLGFYSSTGFYQGCIRNVRARDTLIQAQFYRRQDSKFAMGIAKKILETKIHNQKVILRRYARHRENQLDEDIRQISILQKKIYRTKNIQELMGVEGITARLYFQAIGRMLEEPFQFTHRSRRPARDPFNALINYGYAILQSQVEGKLIARGFHPTLGLIHRSHGNSAALSFDLMEEWRPVIVDSLALQMLTMHEMKENVFTINEMGEVRMTSDGLKIYLKKIEEKYETKASYIKEAKEITFRRALMYQIDSLAEAMLKNDISNYKPYRIR